MGFVLQWNDLESLQIAMSSAIRKAACRAFALRFLDRMLRTVTDPVKREQPFLRCFITFFFSTVFLKVYFYGVCSQACLHDLLWSAVSVWEKTLTSSSVAKSVPMEEENSSSGDGKDQDPSSFVGGGVYSEKVKRERRDLKRRQRICSFGNLRCF